MKHINISHRRVLCLKGADRFSFLQGLVTADLNTLVPGGVTLSALLSPQGKIRYLFYIFSTEDAYYLDCHEEQAPALLKQLLMFKLRADIELSTTDLHVYSGANDIAPPAHPLIMADGRNLSVSFWRALSSSSPVIPGDGDHNWLEQRLGAGIPEIGDITLDKTIALEANLDCLGAVSWTKGCYLGQEITARSHYRGLLKRRLAPVYLEKGMFPEEGGFVSSDDHGPIPLLSRYQNKALIMLPRALWSHAGLSYEGEPVRVIYPEEFIRTFLPEGP